MGDNSSEVEYEASKMENASEVEYEASEVECYPFLKDEEFIKCAESKSGSSGQTTDETGATSCCLYKFVDRINQSFDEFIADYLRADNVSITCNITQDNFTAPLAFDPTNSCVLEDSSDGVVVCNSTCVQEYLKTEIHRSYNDQCFVELMSDFVLLEYPVAVFTFLLILFGAVLNGSVLMVYCKQRSLWKPLNLYLVNTLLADTLFLVVVQPMYLNNLLTDQWQPGELVCKIYISINLMFLFIMIYLTTALSVERYHLIVNCLQSHTADMNNTKRRVIAVNLCVWIIAILFSSPYFVAYRASKDYNCVFEAEWLYWYILVGARILLLFIVPFSLILVFYIVTFFKMTRRIVSPESISNNDEMKSREKTARMFLVIIAVYFVCHLPFNILIIKLISDPNWTPWERYWQGQVLFIVFRSLRVTNFCSNSIIIIAMSSEVRSHVLNLLHLGTITKLVPIPSTGTSTIELTSTDDT